MSNASSAAVRTQPTVTGILLRLPQVKELTCLSKSEIYRRMGDGSFPSAIRISHRYAVWRRDSVVSWLAEALGETLETVERLIGRVSSPAPAPAPDPLERVGVRLLSRRDVKRYVGLSKREIYRLITIGRFPAPVSIVRIKRTFGARMNWPTGYERRWRSTVCVATWWRRAGGGEAAPRAKPLNAMVPATGIEPVTFGLQNRS